MRANTLTRTIKIQDNDGIPEVSAQEVFSNLGKIRIVDVRRPDEFNGELGHIQGAELITLGPELNAFLQTTDRSQEIVFVCRSGGRSGNATAASMSSGFTRTANMIGGMLGWNRDQLPTEK